MNLFSTSNPDVKPQVELMSPLFTLENDRFSQNSQGRIKHLMFYIDRVEGVNVLGLRTLVNTPPSPVLTNPTLEPQFSFHLSQQNDASYKLRITPKGFGGGQGQSAPIKQNYTYKSSQEKKLFQAAKSGDFENFKVLLDQGANVNAKESIGNNPKETYSHTILDTILECNIHRAARGEMITYLVKKGAIISDSDFSKAAKLGIADLLLDNSDYRPTTQTLNLGISLGDTATISECLKLGVNPTQKEMEVSLNSEAHSLSPTAYKTHVSRHDSIFNTRNALFISTIIEKIDIKIAPLKSVLQNCYGPIRATNLDRAKKLVERGADVSDIFESSLIVGDVTLIQLFLEKGSNPSLCPNWFEMLNNHPQIPYQDKSPLAKAILEKGGNPNSPEISLEKTPIYLAIQLGFVSLFPLLLEKNKEPLKTELLSVLIQTAIQPKDKLEIAQQLITAKIPVNFGEDELKKLGIEKSPLYLAIQSGHSDIIELLLNAGANYHKLPKNIYRLIPQNIQNNLMIKGLKNDAEFLKNLQKLSSKICDELDNDTLDRLNNMNKMPDLKTLVSTFLQNSKEVIFGCPLLLGDQNELRLEQNALVKNLSECLKGLLSKKSYLDKELNQNGISEALKENLFIWFDTLEKEYKKEVEQQQKFNLLVQQQQTLESQLTQQKHQNLLSKEQLQLQQEQIYLQQEQFLKLQKENKKNQQLIQGAYAAVSDAEYEIERLKGKITYGNL